MPLAAAADIQSQRQGAARASRLKLAVVEPGVQLLDAVAWQVLRVQAVGRRLVLVAVAVAVALGAPMTTTIERAFHRESGIAR
jgi:hypothetical protein